MAKYLASVDCGSTGIKVRCQLLHNINKQITSNGDIS